MAISEHAALKYKLAEDLIGQSFEHVKTGGCYEVVGCAHDEADPDRVLVIYDDQRKVKNSTWARSYDEFVDGRFVKIDDEDYPTAAQVRGILAND